MTTKNQFFEEKYNNFCSFVLTSSLKTSSPKLNELSTNKPTSCIFRAFVRQYVLPYYNELENMDQNNDRIKQLIEQFSLDLSKVEPADIGKFKRYLKCFCENL